MTVLLSTHCQIAFSNTEEWGAIERTAGVLVSHLNTPEALERINQANQPGRSSADIQSTFLDFARGLGFESEKQGLFGDSAFALRPDYYLRMEDTGILLEVERGKTTINNMDLLDFWKCHLCPNANYLFLMVPQALRQNPSMSPRNEFATVNRRLSEFFRPGNETNVRGLALFGY
jgi:hypothetical protein